MNAYMAYPDFAPRYRTIVFAPDEKAAFDLAKDTETLEAEELDCVKIERFPLADPLYIGETELDLRDLDDRAWLMDRGWECDGYMLPYWSYCAACPRHDLCEAGK